MAVPIERFEGVVVEDASLLAALFKAAENAELLVGRTRAFAPSRDDSERRVGFAAEASLSAVNALMKAASARCRKLPPPADIDMVTDTSGRLIYRCQHASPHRWDLVGNPLP